MAGEAIKWKGNVTGTENPMHKYRYVPLKDAPFFVKGILVASAIALLSILLSNGGAQVLAELTKIGHSQITNPNRGDIMTTTTPQRDEDLSEQIEHAIETVLDLANPPHEQDSETGEPFAPDAAPLEGVTEAELEQQALAHPGADGDASTPE